MQARRPNKQQSIMLRTFIADLRYNRISEITNKSGHESPSLVVKLVKDELGLVITKQTAIRILKEDVSAYKDKRPSSNENIKDIIKQLNVLDGIINDPNSKKSDVVRATTAYSNLMTTKLKFEKQHADLELQKVEKSRPVYKCLFGSYKCTLIKCPKCGHKFHNIPEKASKNNEEKKEEKEPFLKSGDGQSTLYKKDDEK